MFSLQAKVIVMACCCLLAQQVALAQANYSDEESWMRFTDKEKRKAPPKFADPIYTPSAKKEPSQPQGYVTVTPPPAVTPPPTVIIEKKLEPRLNGFYPPTTVGGYYPAAGWYPGAAVPYYGPGYRPGGRLFGYPTGWTPGLAPGYVGPGLVGPGFVGPGMMAPGLMGPGVTWTEKTKVIQSGPSKSSGNYYSPSTADPTASGGYYAPSGPQPSVTIPIQRSE